MKNRSKTTKVGFPAKLLLFGLALALGSTLAGADPILVNGDFQDGKAHWKGDGKDAASDDITDINSPLSNQGSTSGMLLQLRSDWTSVSQIFNTRETELVFSMSYKTSSDFALGNGNGGDGSIGGIESVIENLVGFPLQHRDIMIHKNCALVVISDPSQNLVIYSEVRLPAASSDEQKVSTKIPGLMAHEEKTFYLAFPPGTGTITFHHIALDKPDGGAAAPESPFQN
jgi:hypothetical protein